MSIEDELAENESYVSARNDLDLEIMVAESEPVIYIKISGFDDKEEANEYADTLIESLPLLLFESTRLH